MAQKLDVDDVYTKLAWLEQQVGYASDREGLQRLRGKRIEYGGGVMRLHKYGLEVLADAVERPGIWFLDEYLRPDGTTANSNVNLAASIQPSAVLAYLYAETATAASNARVVQNLSDATPGSELAEVFLEATPDGLGSQQVVLNVTSTVGGNKRVIISSGVNGPAAFVVDRNTSDPGGTLLDGSLWYRTDTDKFRARVNGATVNLTTSADSVGWTPTITSQSTAYTAVKNDVVLASNTITITLTAAATVGSGGIIVVKNTGTGVVTVDGNASETIDGALTYTLGINESITLITNGSNWFII